MFQEIPSISSPRIIPSPANLYDNLWFSLVDQGLLWKARKPPSKPWISISSVSIAIESKNQQSRLVTLVKQVIRWHSIQIERVVTAATSGSNRKELTYFQFLIQQELIFSCSISTPIGFTILTENGCPSKVAFNSFLYNPEQSEHVPRSGRTMNAVHLSDPLFCDHHQMRKKRWDHPVSILCSSSNMGQPLHSYSHTLCLLPQLV